MLKMPCILFWVHSNIIMSCVNLSHVTIVTCCISHVTCHTLHVLGNAMHSVPSAFNLCHISTCHMSHVAFHMSQCHMPLDMSCIVQSPCSWPNKITIYGLIGLYTDIEFSDSPKVKYSQNKWSNPSLCQGLRPKRKTNIKILYINDAGTTLKSGGEWHLAIQ